MKLNAMTKGKGGLVPEDHTTCSFMYTFRWFELYTSFAYMISGQRDSSSPPSNHMKCVVVATFSVVLFNYLKLKTVLASLLGILVN